MVGTLFKFIRKHLIVLLIIFFVLNGLLFSKVILSPGYSYGHSMEPTLKYHTISLLYYPLFIKKNDIVFIQFEDQFQTHRLIKRIIGVPGDYVEVKNKVVFINQEAYMDNFSNTKCFERLNTDVPCDKTITFEKIMEKSNLTGDEIPKDYYFVLGDHREKSLDSRHFGLIHKDKIRGKLAFPLIMLDETNFFNEDK